ncbi:nitrate regulatory protein NasR [Klebsiella michiganensis]|nr:nitrate regulatory protein NasR [Klebsiella michiganensis]MBQ4654634.1 ANTAR domain-containing protein [Klebsiella michiganensis]MBQ4662963.1 ANTAR domain-containing protein [Klebsiella michiganensis]MBZ7129901.1 ANTAR domain-containing protein [Klebsiella michiganensis]MDK3150942.1 nitrate regulatory protein NasR [Klebsiella michiganensis]MDV1379431.1 nitrate regulatory protein NasR [Klebsiella michiganensis]
MNNVAGNTPEVVDWFARARRLQKRQLRQLAQQGALAGQISALVHMLQCERGASNIWLCSGGRLYAAECRAGAALVDEQLTRFYAALEPARDAASSALCWRIACAVWYLTQLVALRKRVRGLEIAAEEATGQFSRIIRHLLNIVPQLNDSIDDPQIAGRMVALYSFMQGKELVGQERALGALGFARGQFSDELRQQLVDRIDGQQPCFDTFQALASSPQTVLFVEQSQAGLEIEQLRRVACTRQPPPDEGETALRWFCVQTQRLEQLRGVEERLIADLLNAADALLEGDDREVQMPPADWQEDGIALRLDKQLLPLVRQQAHELQQLSAQLASLKDALEERKLIEKAKSVLMTHQGMQEEQAWQALRKMAMDKNQRMVEIARALLTVKSLWQVPPKE